MIIISTGFTIEDEIEIYAERKREKEGRAKELPPSHRTRKSRRRRGVIPRVESPVISPTGTCATCKTFPASVSRAKCDRINVNELRVQSIFIHVWTCVT